MNKLIQAIKSLDCPAVEALILKEPKWLTWAEPSDKNALHYLCGIAVGDDKAKADASLAILKSLLKQGMDINSVHRIDDAKCDFFPATPLWYAYTRGRNETLYKYLLKHGADTRNCWWAIAWYDDVAAGKLWLKHGAVIDQNPTLDELFVGTCGWKKMAFAKWLLDLGADPNAAADKGVTPLMLAVKRKDEESIKMLMRFGADPNKESQDGSSARKLAEQRGPRRLLGLL